MNEDLYGLQASGIDPEIAAKMIPLQRQRMIASALLKQSMEPINVPQGTKISPFQGLAKIVQAYMAQKDLADADKQSQELSAANQAAEQRALGAYEKVRNGYEIPPTTPNDDEGNVNPNVQVAGDKRKAVAMAMASPLLMKNPLVTGDIQSMRESQKPFSLKADEVRYGPNGEVVAKNPKEPPLKDDSYIPENWQAPTGTKAGPAPGTIWMNGSDGKPELYSVNFKNGLPVGYKKLDTSTKVSVPVSVSTEKSYGSKFAGQIAEQDSSMLDAARKAPELATRANNILGILANEKPYTGMGAEFKTGFDKALSASGLTDSSGRAVSTEVLAADLASGTLDAIKASGLGSGNGFSNADRDFLEKAKGGKINLEAGTLKRLAELQHRAASLSANQWNTRVKDIPDDALKGTGIKRDPFNVPALFGAQANGKSVVERRTTASGKKLVKYSDGSIGEE